MRFKISSDGCCVLVPGPLLWRPSAMLRGRRGRRVVLCVEQLRKQQARRGRRQRHEADSLGDELGCI